MSYSECEESSKGITRQRRFVISWSNITSPSHRVLTGIFIKMGQHMATLVVLPVEWTSTMKILQDRCEPTPYSALEDLFLVDMGVPVTELFYDFDPTPIGVASLAQVHVGHHRASGQKVAVKVSLFYESHIRQYPKRQLSSNILTLRNFATLIWTWWRLLSVCVFLLLIVWCVFIV